MDKPIFRSLAQAAEAYYEELRRFALRRTGSQALADDVVQETWLRARTTSVAMPYNPRAYLYRMTGNLAADHLQRRGEAARRQIDGALAEQVACPTPIPDVEVAARQEFALLSDAVRDLPEKCRQVFILYRGHGLTMRQVAARLGISEKTVEKHIARAMIQCRKRLREAGRET